MVPNGEIAGAFGIGGLFTALPGQVPVEQQAGLDLHRRAVEIGNVVGDRPKRDIPRHRLRMQMRKGSNTFQVAFGNRLSGRVKNTVTAEVFDQKDAGIEVGLVDIWRAKAFSPNVAGDGDKRDHIFGDMGELLIIFAVLKDGAGLVTGRGPSGYGQVRRG